MGVDPDPANAGPISEWAWDHRQESSTRLRGRRLHQLHDGNEGQDRSTAFDRGNDDRLTEVKDRYDPDNTFHINQNIQPASAPNP